MLKRKIANQLEIWKKGDRNRALLLTGARQVGKTTAIREFAKRHYRHFVEVNFVKYPQAIRAFESELSTRAIVTNLSAMGFGPFVEGETLVFFDEIQECPNARTAIKFLVEEHCYDFVESGSLLGINYKVVPSYPVGFEEEIKVYPLDFEEFLWARGVSGSVISVLENAYRCEAPVPDFIHEQISKYYREYLVVGGLPEVVQTFVSTNDFSQSYAIQKAILSTYRADITHYAGRWQTLVKRVFDAMPSELGKQDKRFVLAHLEKGASLRKYEDPTQWLVDSGLAYYSFNTSAFELPFEATENRNLYKLYMVDTGLLSCQLLHGLAFDVLAGDISINEGAITENFVACALAAKGIALHYFDRKSKQELDFIIPEKGKITILEVKSSAKYMAHASLNAALLKDKEKIYRALVLSGRNVEKEGNVLYLPLYMAMFL